MKNQTIGDWVIPNCAQQDPSNLLSIHNVYLFSIRLLAYRKCFQILFDVNKREGEVDVAVLAPSAGITEVGKC